METDLLVLVGAIVYMIGVGIMLVMLVRWRHKQEKPFCEEDSIGIAAASAIWPIVLVWLLFEGLKRPSKQEG
jgi:hypothetical protein